MEVAAGGLAGAVALQGELRQRRVLVPLVAGLPDARDRAKTRAIPVVVVADGLAAGGGLAQAPGLVPGEGARPGARLVAVRVVLVAHEPARAREPGELVGAVVAVGARFALAGLGQPVADRVVAPGDGWVLGPGAGRGLVADVREPVLAVVGIALDPGQGLPGGRVSERIARVSTARRTALAVLARLKG